jgi:hypothetical protein
MTVPSSDKSSTDQKSLTDYTTVTWASNTRTYSTSALETNAETSSSSLTEDTLNMISTPWSTESWNDTTSDTYGTMSSLISWPSTEDTSVTVHPKSSTSYGVTTPAMNTSGATVTLLNARTPFSDSHTFRPLLKQKSSRSDTFSSWTIESFTSTGLPATDTNVMRVNYPWSPKTVVSGTDVYPSSLESQTSQKVSRETITTTFTSSERGHIPPWELVGVHRQKPVLDWAFVKLKGFRHAVKVIIVWIWLENNQLQYVINGINTLHLTFLSLFKRHCVSAIIYIKVTK